MARSIFEAMVRALRPASEPGALLRERRRRRPEVPALEDRCLLSITIAIDYSHDTANFFDTPEKRVLMQSAADLVAGALSNDHLDAIVPSGGNTWTADFSDPATGATQSVSNLTVPSDTIILYVGGRALTGGGEAGLGSTGGFSASGDRAWLNTVAARGHVGALAATPSNFGPWGGSIAFDTGSTHWFFGSSTAGLDASETDFFTVAEHEVGHVLGLGTSNSWFSHVAGNVFDGPAAMAVYGGPVPLDSDLAHWADGTQSDGVNAVMDPILYNGHRSLFASLDYAGLADVGWLVQMPSRSSTVQFSASSYNVPANVGLATITVNRTGGVGAFTVNYATSDGTAQAGVDYQATSGTLSFGPTDDSEMFTIPILNAGKTSGSETVNISLSSPGLGANLGAMSTALLTIVNQGQSQGQGQGQGSRPADDFDGDGRADLGVFRASTANWFVLPSGNGPWSPITFGAPNLSDIPVPADYNGDGRTDLAVFRLATAQWFIGGNPQPFTFGAPNLFDIPVPADYLGTGSAQPAVFRPSTGQWFLGGQAQPIGFGGPNLLDIPVPGDYDGVGHAELAVFRPSTGQWFIAGHAHPVSFGGPNLLDLPAPGDYDGVGHTELAVFRPSTGQWFIAGHAQPVSFGATNLFDLPLETSVASLAKLGVVGIASPSPSPSTPSSGASNLGGTTGAGSPSATTPAVPVAPATPPVVVAGFPAQKKKPRRKK